MRTSKSYHILIDPLADGNGPKLPVDYSSRKQSNDENAVIQPSTIALASATFYIWSYQAAMVSSSRPFPQPFHPRATPADRRQGGAH